MAAPIIIRGVFSSPYSLKMRAVLRYRRIPHRWVLRGSEWDVYPQATIPVIPVLIFPDERGEYVEAMADSSPQIARLERDVDGRSVVPPDPSLSFIDFLIEDFVDEWVTKAMYHYRWTYAPDIEKAARLLPLDEDLQASDAQLAQMHDWIIERQVGRRSLVGSTEANQPVIEGSWERLLDLLQDHFASHDFLLGERPGRGDFALYGQLKPMLWWDPTPTAIAVDRAPRAVNWIERMDDLSWWEVDGDKGWHDTPAPTITTLLGEIGRTYTPFMLANAAALDAGSDEMVCEIDGHEYRQAPFKYQGKCLAWVRDAYVALGADDRAVVDRRLADTGCRLLFA